VIRKLKIAAVRQGAEVAGGRDKQKEKGLRRDTRSGTSGVTGLRDTTRFDTVRYGTIRHDAPRRGSTAKTRTRRRGERLRRGGAEVAGERETSSGARRGQRGSYPILWNSNYYRGIYIRKTILGRDFRPRGRRYRERRGSTVVAKAERRTLKAEHYNTRNTCETNRRGARNKGGTRSLERIVTGGAGVGVVVAVRTARGKRSERY
jgi:hypothetical protein